MTRAPFCCAGAALIALAACSSSTEPTPSTLTSLDARRAAGAYASLSIGGREAFTEVDSVTSACPKGGTVRTTMLDDATSSTTRASVVFASCAVADSSGQVWTFTSLPRFDMSITSAFSDTSLTVTSTTTGTMRVQSTTVDGTCAINTRLSAVLRLTSPGGVLVRQTGQVCGQSVDVTSTEPSPRVTLPN